MFYQENNDNLFRFGDILKGFIFSTPNLSEPFMKPFSEDYFIEISRPLYCAIISPCCSISDKTLSLSPLIRVVNSFYNNPYFAEDLTRVNRVVPPINSVPPQQWDNMDTDKRQELLNQEPGYTFLDLFVYKENELFPEYEIHRKGTDNIKTRNYMIDFRNTFKVSCSKIKDPKNVPIEAKCLQLTIEARADLRDKISFYYGRIPNEDKTD